MPKIRLAILCLTFLILTGTALLAAECPEPFIKAMQLECLAEDRIVRVCERWEQLGKPDKPEISLAKVEKDIAGKMVAGWIFGKTEWREIEILNSRYSAEKAKIEIHMDTIRNKSGTLRLYYRWTGSKWKLAKIFNVDFN